MILPQGEFATFLRARSEDKGKLLEKVFGTAFFRRVQDEIVEAGRAAQARRQSAVDEIRLAVHALAVSAGLETERRDVLEALSRTAPESLDAELTQVVDELTTRERHAGKASARRSRPTSRWPTWSATPGCACNAASDSGSSSSRSTTSASRQWPSDGSARRSREPARLVPSPAPSAPWPSPRRRSSAPRWPWRTPGNGSSPHCATAGRPPCARPRPRPVKSSAPSPAPSPSRGRCPAASGSWRDCASGSTAYAGRWHPCRPSSRRCPGRSRCTTRP